MPETCRVVYNNKYIVASSGYLSSISYMMHGHIYIINHLLFIIGMYCVYCEVGSKLLNTIWAKILS